MMLSKDHFAMARPETEFFVMINGPSLLEFFIVGCCVNDPPWTGSVVQVLGPAVFIFDIFPWYLGDLVCQHQ